MLDMGFKPQVEKIVRRVPQSRQTMLFSATLDGEVGELARQLHPQPEPLRGRAARARGRRPASTAHQFVSVTNDDKVDR